ncbi:MAG: ankyrin repeat domain-containing protein [Acidobacteria bacterium]|nr:ankyrin repeat domain-containing protein [Acidobacteriota bacterium]
MTLRARVGLKAILCLTVFCLLCGASTSMQGGKKKEAKWEYNESSGVPVRIALNDVVYSSFADRKPMRREIFILIDAQYFKPDNLKTLFTGLSSDYDQPGDLSITAFSDKAMLRRAIDRHQSGMVIDWADTPKGREAAERWYKKYYPLSSGYYRANYSRIPRRYYTQTYFDEYFLYSPYSAKEEMITVVLRSKPAPPYSGNVNSDLIIAIDENDIEKVKSLLDKGADINARIENGDTALMMAVNRTRDIKLVNLLLDKGADVSAKNNNDDRLQLNQTALIYASIYEETEIVIALLERGADVNAQNNYGYSPLIMAAAHERLGNVKALLEKGADVNATDEEGTTALMRSAARGDAGTVRALLVGRADVNSRNKKGETALMLVPDHKESILLLLNNGARVNETNKLGETPLMYAAKERAVDKMRLLLERNADVKARSKNGETALTIAQKRSGNKAMIRLLSDAEAKRR